MEFSANDIAALLNGEVEGDGNIKVSNISKIDQSVPGTLTFLSNPAYTKFIYTTTASLVIVNKDFLSSINVTVYGDESVKKVLKDGTVVAASAYENSMELDPGDAEIFMFPTAKK